MKYSNNKIFIFSGDKKNVERVSKILKKEYPGKKQNLVAFSSRLPDALEKLKDHYDQRIYFDIIILDLRIPLQDRRALVEVVDQNQVSYECIVASTTSDLPQEEIAFIKKINAIIIPDISEITLFPLIQNVIQKKFNERKYLLINRVDNVLNSEIEGFQVLNHIVNLTLEALDLRICWIALVDHKAGNFNIAALTGFAEFEDEFREQFNVSLADEAVISECVERKVQVQYMDVLADDCPFKYKDLAQRMGMKSILITPVFDRRGLTSKQVLATLNIYTKFYHEFLEDELELTRIIASKITAAIFTKGIYKAAPR